MNKFELEDRVKITVGKGKGIKGIIYYIIPPNPERDKNPHYGYLVKLENGDLPWYAESELERDKERVVFT